MAKLIDNLQICRLYNIAPVIIVGEGETKNHLLGIIDDDSLDNSLVLQEVYELNVKRRETLGKEPGEDGIILYAEGAEEDLIRIANHYESSLQTIVKRGCAGC